MKEKQKLNFIFHNPNLNQDELRKKIINISAKIVAETVKKEIIVSKNIDLPTCDLVGLPS